MRKYIIWGLVLITLIFGITVILRGSKILNFNILSYGQIGEKDKELDKKIEELKQKSIKEFEQVKEEYLNKIEAAKTAGAEGGVQIESYDIEFLWTVLRKLCNR